MLTATMSAQSVKLFKGKTEFATFSSQQVDRVAFDKQNASAKLYKDNNLVKEYGNQTVDSVAFVKEISRAKLNVGVSDFSDISNSKGKQNATANEKIILKSEWEEGDQILIWLDTNTNASHKNPNYLLTYSNGAWTETSNAATSETTSCTPEATGTLKYVYYGNVIVAGTKDYTYDGTEISAYLDNWQYLSEIQVVVRGFASDDDPTMFSLSCDQFKPIYGYNITETGVEATYGNMGGEATSIKTTESGTFAYVFGTADYSSSPTYYDFQIYKRGGLVWEHSPKAAITENDGHQQIKNLSLIKTDFTEPDVKYVNLNGVKWATRNVGATTDTGSMKTCAGDYFTWGATEPWYTSLTYNDSGEHKDASGAYNGSNPGHYFTADGWNSYTFYNPYDNTETIYNNKTFQYVWPESPYTTGSKVYKYNKSDGKTILDDSDDVAKVNWGAIWRMPETSDWNTLAAACGLNAENGKAYTQQYTTAVVPDNNELGKGVYHCTNYGGVPGILFCDGINQVFFPSAGMFAAGKQFSNYSGTGYEGRYWTRVLTPGTSGSEWDKYYYGIVAIDFYYNSGVTAKGQLNDPTISRVARNTGRTVRGVRDDGKTNKTSDTFIATTYNWTGDTSAKASLTKTGWENGDKIYIWFDGSIAEKPDMIWTYSKIISDWETNLAEDDSKLSHTKELKANDEGTFKALYQGKDLTVVGKTKYNVMTEGSAINLNAYITDWKFLSEIQVAVKNLTLDDAANYTLSCPNLTPITGYTLTSDGATANLGTQGAGVTGTSNGTDVIFTFATTDSYDASTNYTFTLKKDGADDVTYTASGKTITKNTKQVALIILK